MNKLVLFDIDKTLLDRSICHHVAFSYAFKKVYNITVDISIINYAGMTDPQIIIEVLKAYGLNETIIMAKINDCMKAIIDYFEKNSEKENIPVLAGVNELLRELKKKNILIGLITGNLEPIARKKLEKVGLNHYFEVCAFGSDDINRTEIVKIAIKRAEENFNFKGGSIFVIGDTILDIKAGLEAGAKTMGVATGSYSKEELKNSGADFVFNNLEHKNEILKIIKDV